MDTDAVTEEPGPSPEGEATPVPPVFYWVLWVSVFAVLVWGFQILMRPRPPREPPDHSP